LEHSAKQIHNWYIQYGEAVNRRCYRMLGNRAAAWDATQEVFVRAHKSASAFRGDCTPLSWLLTIADRYCLTTLRKRTLRHARKDDFAEFNQLDKEPCEGVEQLLVRTDLVRKLLAYFKRDVQRIVVLRFFDGLEQETIAQQLGISRKTVQRKLDRFYQSSQRILNQLSYVAGDRAA